MSCCGKRFCINLINKLAWKLSLSVTRAVRVDGVIYLFCIIDKNGEKKLFKTGKETERYLINEMRKK